MIVFYTGPKKWKGPLTLSDYLDIPEELKEYVINKVNGTEIVKEQKANPEINVFTGIKFPENTSRACSINASIFK